jgi:hypothetical protein
MRRLLILVLLLLLTACTLPAPGHSQNLPYIPTPSPTATVQPSARVEQAAEIDPLTENYFYTAGEVAAVTCSFPGGRLASRAALIKYATAVVRCLDEAWAPIVERAGFVFTPPKAVHPAPTGSADGECGSMDKGVLAFYCAQDLGIYFNWPEYVDDEPADQAYDRGAVQYLMAHEYGHHVQWMTGMADEYDRLYGIAHSKAEQQRNEDRNETQAHCFAAVFFGANRKTLHLRGEQLSHYGHPGFNPGEVGPNFPRWLRQGFTARGPAACNTWTPPYDKIK